MSRSRQPPSKPASQPEKRPIPPVLSLRLNDDERALLEELSEGIKPSSYVKQAVFEGQFSPSSHNKLLFIDRQRYAKILALLGDYSPPLRVLAKAALSGSLPLNQETLDTLEQACAAIFEIRDLLISAQKLKAHPGQVLH